MKDQKNESKGRPPGRKLTKGDLAKVTGGSEILHGCCTQCCCGDDAGLRAFDSVS